MNNSEKFFKDLAGGATWSAGVAFKRSNPLPLDRYSVFETLEKAQEYVDTNPVAYPGQLVAVVSDAEATAYVIQGNGNLIKLAATTGTGDVGQDLKNLTNDVTSNKQAIEALQEANKTFVVKNTDITGGTHAKITYDAKGLVTKGEDLVEDDIPALSTSKITGLDDKLGTLATSEALKAVSDDLGKASVPGEPGSPASGLHADVEANTKAIAVLNGSGDGSVKKSAEDAATAAVNEFATKISDDKTVNTFKELVDYVGTHGTEAAGFASSIKAIEADLGKGTSEGGSASGLHADVETNASAIAANDAKITELVTADQTINNAITETKTKLGFDKTLNTTADNAIEAINEVKVTADATKTAIGDGSLDTSAKTIIPAINEVKVVADGAVQKHSTDGVADRLMTDAEGKKLAGITAGAQVNKIEIVKQNGIALSISEDKSVDVDAYSKATVNEKEKALEGKITAAKEQADLGVKNAATAQGKADANATAIEELSKVDTAQAGRIKALEDTVNGGSGSTGLVKDLSDLTSTVSGHTTKISNIEASLKPDGSVGQLIANNASSIQAITSQLGSDGTTGKAIAANANAIKTLQGADVEIKKDVQANADNIALKANAADVYTKAEIGGSFSAEKTLVAAIAADKAELQDNINKKADKATTLEGYGITDAYTQTEVQTKISEAIAAAPHLKRQIVKRGSHASDLEALNALETKDINTIYMMKDASVAGEAGENDTYKEYMYISNAFVLVGNSKVNLTNYIQKSSKEFTDLQQKATDNAAAIETNRLANIVINGVSGNFSDHSVSINLPLATAEKAGLVKSADAENKIFVEADGTMSIKKINVDNIDWTGTLILDGGAAAIK